MPLNANNLINDTNYVPIITEDGKYLIVTEPGNKAPDGVFIIASSSLSVRSGGSYPHENRRSWLRREPRHVKR
jgi:hypothetical protein